MSGIVDRATAVLEGVTPEPWDVRDGFIYPLAIRCGLGSIRIEDAEFIAAARMLMPELVAEVERLHTWDGLMSLVDEHYPTDIFPHFAGVPDNPDRDPGPRILSLLREVERLRSYKSLPPGMVWQDYYSPDDVCKIREPLDAEIEHLRKITDIIDPDSVYREQRDQAWAERDAANAEVERVRADLERVRALAARWDSALEATTGNPSIVAKAFAAEVFAALEADR